MPGPNSVVIKSMLADILETYVDPPCDAEGFSRRGTSAVYRRSVGKTKQSIEFTTRIPRQSNEVAVYLSGVINVYIPEVTTLALEMVAGNTNLLAFQPETTMFVPLGFVGPTASYREWSVRNIADFHEVGADLSQYMREYGFPFLNEYLTAADIAARSGADNRVLKSQGWPVNIASALLLVDRPNQALRTLENAFGSSEGTKRRYESAISFVVGRQ